MNRKKSVLFITWFFIILFLCMIGYLCRFVYKSGDEMLSNPYNTRQNIYISKNIRGMILDKNGVVLAESIVNDEGKEVRNYPYHEMFAHVIGYSTKGRLGVEKDGNHYLIQSDLSLFDKIENQKKGIKNSGNNLYTTLDFTLQKTAYEAMGNYSGAVIVSNIKTGEILAMVSKPDFDPNMISIEWENFMKEEQDGPLINRCIMGLYPPGSTFKILTALEFYREEKDNIVNYQYSCNGLYEKEGSQIHCYRGKAHGDLDIKESFAQSCNASFANIGFSLDSIKMDKLLKDMLFEEQGLGDFFFVQSRVDSFSEMNLNQRLQTYIGQGTTQMTPMHIHLITCAIGNQGEIMEPYVLDRVENAKGFFIKSLSKNRRKRILGLEESEFLKELMWEVVENGTAKGLKNEEYTVAGKTGSAEFSNIKGESHAWFTSFAPVEDPQIAVTVILEKGGSGGKNAAPVAKEIYDTFFHKVVD